MSTYNEMYPFLNISHRTGRDILRFNQAQFDDVLHNKRPINIKIKNRAAKAHMCKLFRDHQPKPNRVRSVAVSTRTKADLPYDYRRNYVQEVSRNRKHGIEDHYMDQIQRLWGTQSLGQTTQSITATSSPADQIENWAQSITRRSRSRSYDEEDDRCLNCGSEEGHRDSKCETCGEHMCTECELELCMSCEIYHCNDCGCPGCKKAVRKMPANWVRKKVRGTHRKPCSECGHEFDNSFGTEYYFVDMTNGPWGAEKLCSSCMSMRQGDSEEEHSEEEYYFKKIGFRW